MYLCTTSCIIFPSIWFKYWQANCTLMLLCHCFVYTPGMLPETILSVIHFPTYITYLRGIIMDLLLMVWASITISKCGLVPFMTHKEFCHLKYTSLSVIAVCSYCHYTSVNAIAEKYFYNTYPLICCKHECKGWELILCDIFLKVYLF